MKKIAMVIGLIALLSRALLADTNATVAISPTVAAAKDDGKRLAAIDFTNGVYRMQTYGFMSAKMNPAEEYLK